MPELRHQTIKLSTGRHRSLEDGTCAMELASILADEPFSDHPASVCPVVAAFLRSYNDHVDDERRRDLFPYAAAAVGTAHGLAQARERAAICLHWVRTTCVAPPLRVRVLHRLLGCQGPDIDGVYAARAAAADPATHRIALGLLDELIAVGQTIPGRSRSPASAEALIRAG